MRKKGFTLIELLVVISIIALLMSILMPSLSKVKSMARNVVCGAHLRDWGMSAFAFASDNNGDIPTCFGHGSGPNLRMPLYLNDVSSETTRGALDPPIDDYTSGEWKQYGVPYLTWKQYGLTDELLICPAQNWQLDWKPFHGDNSKEVHFIPSTYRGDSYTYWGGDWRRWVQTTYQYFGGIEYLDNGGHNWYTKGGKKIPPYNKKIKTPGSSILAADVVMYVPPGTPWEKHIENESGVYINHKGKGNVPTAQTLVFGDGHTELRGSNFYTEPIENDDPMRYGSDASWSFASHSLGGGYWGPTFYWEGTSKE